MKIFKNKVFLGILCIMAGLVAGFVILPAFTNNTAETRPVLVMKMTVQAGTQLTADMVTTENLPKSAFPGAAGEPGRRGRQICRVQSVHRGCSDHGQAILQPRGDGRNGRGFRKRKAGRFGDVAEPGRGRVRPVAPRRRGSGHGHGQKRQSIAGPRSR